MSEHSGSTDQITQVKLTSSIQQVQWTRRVGVPGGKIGLEIHTHFVGGGADLEIEISDHAGKQFGKFKDRIYANRFWADLVVPPEARTALYATVKLPRHGLTRKTEPLLLVDPFKFTNLKWDKPHVAREQTVKLTADVQGLPEAAEVGLEIWEQGPEGISDFVTRYPVVVKQKKIESEWEFDYLKEVTDIPTAEESPSGYFQPQYFFRLKLLGVEADSPMLPFKDTLTLVLLGESGAPAKGQQYKLYLADGQTKEGSLDASGLAKLEELPPGWVRIEFPKLFKEDAQAGELGEDTIPPDAESLAISPNPTGEPSVRAFTGRAYVIEAHIPSFEFSL